VREYPARVKCATLAWHTLDAALKKRTTGHFHGISIIDNNSVQKYTGKLAVLYQGQGDSLPFNSLQKD